MVQMLGGGGGGGGGGGNRLPCSSKHKLWNQFPEVLASNYKYTFNLGPTLHYMELGEVQLEKQLASVMTAHTVTNNYLSSLWFAGHETFNL